MIPAVLVVSAAAIAACQLLTPKEPRPIDFSTEIKPILETSCLECHNHVDASIMGSLDLETRQSAFTTGLNAPVIIPGAPERSLLTRVLRLGHAHPTAMPPSPDKLWQEKQRLIREWIRQGAPWPDSVRLMRPQDWPENRQR